MSSRGYAVSEAGPVLGGGLCWCGGQAGHGWPGRVDGEPHPRDWPGNLDGLPLSDSGPPPGLLLSIDEKGGFAVPRELH